MAVATGMAAAIGMAAIGTAVMITTTGHTHSGALRRVVAGTAAAGMPARQGALQRAARAALGTVPVATMAVVVVTPAVVATVVAGMAPVVEAYGSSAGHARG